MNMYKAMTAFVCLGAASMNFGYFGQKPMGGYFSNNHTDKIVVHVGPAGAYAAAAGVAQGAGQAVQVTNAVGAVVEKAVEPIKALSEQVVQSLSETVELKKRDYDRIMRVVRDYEIAAEYWMKSKQQQPPSISMQQNPSIWNSITSFVAKHKIAVAGVVLVGVAGVALYKYYKAKQAQSAKDNDQK